MIGDLLVPWYGFDMAGERITPELMLFPLALEKNSRADVGDAGALSASLHDNRLANCAGWDSAESIFTTILENE